jgi:hypothetical protein
MAILKAKPDAISDSDHALNRIFPVTTKLTKDELGRVTEFARSQGLARGEWIRDVILRELRGGLASDGKCHVVFDFELTNFWVLWSARVKPYFAARQDSRAAALLPFGQSR